MNPQLSSREKSERALGKAVHPAAIQRLYEIFPDAEVQVLHGSSPHPLLPDGVTWGDLDVRPVRRFSEEEPRYRWTTVTVSTPDGDVLANTVSFYPPVQFSRRRGVSFAFRRLLKDICERTNEANRALGGSD
jgi:hypothetical protein